MKGSLALAVPLKPTHFGRQFKMGRVEKWATDRQNHDPYVSYYPEDRRILFEVSLPYFLTGQNVYPCDVDQAFTKLWKWLEARFGDLPHPGLWACTKIDYFATFQVGGDLPEYLTAMKTLELPRYERVDYQHGGVVWKAKSRHINCYDKYAECSEGSGELRFEVSNRKSSVIYMERSWLGGVGRTPYALARETNAHRVVAHFLDELGVAHLCAQRTQISEFKRLFPKSWAAAMTYRELIAAHGSSTWRDGTMSRTTYYRYAKALAEAGLLTPSPSTLEPLRLVAPSTQLGERFAIYAA